MTVSSFYEDNAARLRLGHRALIELARMASRMTACRGRGATVADILRKAADARRELAILKGLPW
jgi:pilus assembly protein TadC